MAIVVEGLWCRRALWSRWYAIKHNFSSAAWLSSISECRSLRVLSSVSVQFSNIVGFEDDSLVAESVLLALGTSLCDSMPGSVESCVFASLAAIAVLA